MPNVTRCLIIGGVLLTLASFGAFAQTTDLDCDGCVDSDDIANSSIRASDIRKKAILKHHIAPLAVNENKIADGAVSLDKLAPEVTDLIESLSARVDELEAQNIGINGGDFTG